MGNDPGRPPSATAASGRCRCGHYPTHHMQVRSLGSSSSFRLEASGPCVVCGEASCRAYVPAGPSVARD